MRRPNINVPYFIIRPVVKDNLLGFLLLCDEQRRERNLWRVRNGLKPRK